MAQSPFEIKKEICDVGKRIYDHGFVAANDGNISVKVGPNEFYCTPTGVSKGYMTPDMIIRIDGQGNEIDGKLTPPPRSRCTCACIRSVRMPALSCMHILPWLPPSRSRALPWISSACLRQS